MKKIHLTTTDSTNNYAKTLGKTESEDVLVIADTQTAGRGRMGRTFLSRDGGIYMSLLLHPKETADIALQITIMACVAAKRAIESVCNVTAEIKWVNDIYIGGKKVCGILTEGAVNPNTQKLDFAVLGVGINVFTPKDGFGEELKDIATAIYKEEKSGIKEKIIHSFILEFFKIYEDDSYDYMSEYKSASLIIGKDIEYNKAGKTYFAKAVDINENGELVVKQNDKTVILNSGDVKINMNALGKNI